MNDRNIEDRLLRIQSQRVDGLFLLLHSQSYRNKRLLTFGLSFTKFMTSFTNRAPMIFETFTVFEVRTKLVPRST